MKSEQLQILLSIFLLVTPLVLPSVSAIIDAADLIEFAENTSEEAEEEAESLNEYDIQHHYSSVLLQQSLRFNLSKNKTLPFVCLDVTTPPPRFC